MTKIMQKSYRMFQRKRSGFYYLENTRTREQESLGTKSKAEAQRILEARNHDQQTPALNLQVGRAYIINADPKMGTRTWQEAMDTMTSHGVESSQSRCARAFKSPAFNVIRDKPIALTTGEELKTVLKRGGSATNNYLRRLHNLALDHGWLQWNIIPAKQWEKPAKRPKRGITLEEHQKIIAAEQGDERRHYYEMLWLIGAAQSDGAKLTAEKNVNWQTRVISYQRSKTKEWAHLRIGKHLEELLNKLPKQGFLFPKMAALKDKDRSAEFCRRRRLLGLKGVSLHSYRYGWAERAYAAGYDERFAQAALGHKSRAVHYAYAKRAVVICPPMETEPTNVVPLTQNTESKNEAVAVTA